MFDVLIPSLLGVWLILTIFHQFKALPRSIANFFGPWAVIPTWIFFAPNPSRNDYYLFFRDKKENGETTKYHHIPITQDRKLLHSIWNPNKRCNKVLHDCIRALDKAYNELDINNKLRDRKKLEQTLPYILLIGHALEIPKTTPENKSRQILVVQRGYTGEKNNLKPILLSDFFIIPNYEN